MLCPFVTTPDKAEISYSEVLPNHEVRVFVEKWDEARRAFDSMEVFLPSGRITKREGLSEAEEQYYLKHILHLKDIIFACAAEEGNRNDMGRDGAERGCPETALQRRDAAAGEGNLERADPEEP